MIFKMLPGDGLAGSQETEIEHRFARFSRASAGLPAYRMYSPPGFLFTDSRLGLKSSYSAFMDCAIIFLLSLQWRCGIAGSGISR